MRGRFVALAGLALATACSIPPVVMGSSGGTVPASTPAPPAPARSDVDYRRIEAEILAELNAARSNPTAYASKLEQLLPLFDGTLLRRPGARAPIRTQEGAAAVREAIAALRKQTPVPTLALSAGLSRAAGDLAADQGRTGQLGHTGSDGSTPGTRIARYGRWGVSYSENVDYGPFVSGRDVVIDLIVDDGVPDRGHRHNVFDPSARVVGIACGPHPKYGSTCVIDQAGAFTAK